MGNAFDVNRLGPASALDERLLDSTPEPRFASCELITATDECSWLARDAASPRQRRIGDGVGSTASKRGDPRASPARRTPV